MINRVKTEKNILKNLLLRHNIYRDLTIKVSKIITENKTPENIIVNALQNTVFHNLKQVKKLYVAAFNNDFPSYELMAAPIKCRHDIVHRNGKSLESGESIELGVEDVNKLIIQVKIFICDLLTLIKDA